MQPTCTQPTYRPPLVVPNSLPPGARHHGLEPGWIAHLDAQRPYETGGWGPALGRFSALALAVPLLVPAFLPTLLSRALAPKPGPAPPALQQSPAGDEGAGGSGRIAESVAGEQAAAVAEEAAAGAVRVGDAVGAAAVQRAVAEAPTEPLPRALLSPSSRMSDMGSMWVGRVFRLMWWVHDTLWSPVLGSGCAVKDAGGAGSSLSAGPRA
jgi:hypothetical protein